MALITLLLFACDTQDAPDPKVLMADNCGRGNPESCFKLGTSSLNAPTPEYSKARQQFSTGCSVHHAPSCNALGVLVRDARGGPKDLVRAAGLFDTACEKGSSPGCVNFADLLRDGDPTDENVERAAKLYRQECDGAAALPKACASLAEMVRNGDGVKKDRNEADALLIKACDASYAPACAELGNVLVKQGRRDDIATAVEMYDKACGIDAHFGCFELAELHETKKVADASMDQAAEYYKQVCRVDTSRGCYELAEMMTDELVESREGEKEALYKLSCESGFSEACAKR